MTLKNIIDIEILKSYYIPILKLLLIKLHFLCAFAWYKHKMNKLFEIRILHTQIFTLTL